jgi:uncharacterized protein (TIGR02231 family)
MKLLFTLALLTSTSFGAAQAATLPLDSNIDSVTVFPQGADVFRTGQVTMTPGEHQIVVDDLPGDVDPQSIRVEGIGGNGVEIASVDAKPLPITVNTNAPGRKLLEDQIETLSNERVLLDQTISDLATQRQFLLSMAEKQVTPTTVAEPRPIDGASVGGLLDVVASRLALISKESHAARLRQVAIDKSVAELHAKLSVVAPTAPSLLQVAINVVVSTQTTANFKVSYRVQQAGWLALYDAKLTTDTSALELVRRAEITQSTLESWDNVELTLSTARAHGSTAAPELEEQPLLYAEDVEILRKEKSSLARSKQEYAKDDAALSQFSEAEPDLQPAAAPVAVPQKQAALEFAGFNATYKIAGRASIDNTGQSKRVRIASENLSAKLQAIAVPKRDATAYLSATFTLADQGALLPGIVHLHRDGTYVGQGNLPLLVGGEETTLGFGSDDQIRIERKEVKRLSGEEGILTSSNTEERAWDIKVKNLHSKTMPITIIDQLPFATRDDVTVAPLRDQTPPTTKDYKKRRNVLAWTMDMEPQSEKTIRTGYKITLPENLKIGLAD